MHNMQNIQNMHNMIYMYNMYNMQNMQPWTHVACVLLQHRNMNTSFPYDKYAKKYAEYKHPPEKMPKITKIQKK